MLKVSAMSSGPDNAPREETLDPADWKELRALGHRMLDDLLDYTEDIRSRRTLALTRRAIEDICVPLGEEGEGEEAVYEIFLRSILPHALTIASPRLWGAVVGQGSAYGMLTEMLRAGMNGAQEFAFAEAKVNLQVLKWIKEFLEFPQEASGVLTSGGSEANFTALAVARNACAEGDVKADGVQGVRRRMTLYCGDETHRCLERAVELLGLGNRALRNIPTDADCRIRPELLEAAIRRDRQDGYHPFCIIGCAGTTNTGAFDDLNALADLAQKEGMWFHIDGAFGAWVKISRSHRHLVEGMERADSLAVDFHKWMNVPYSVGCALIKDRRAHFSTFAYGHEAEYIKSAFDLSEDQLTNPHNLALPLSRNFSSLKVYMLLRAYGKGKYRRLIQQNLDQAHYLEELIVADAELELTAPVASNVVCFRFRPASLGENEAERVNRKIMDTINKEAFWMISDTTVKGKYMLRACNVNHRTRKEDFDFLMEEVRRVGHAHLG
ncbi:MAG: pyridoxal-dependent decarboxylase [Chromatiaceae bacterium]